MPRDGLGSTEFRPKRLRNRVLSAAPDNASTGDLVMGAERAPSTLLDILVVGAGVDPATSHFSHALYRLSYPTADLTGFEPAASGLTGRRALQAAPQVPVNWAPPQSSLAVRVSIEGAISQVPTEKGPIGRPAFSKSPRPKIPQRLRWQL